jgi:CubicO group peptidase (beta-lactamase class C family)
MKAKLEAILENVRVESGSPAAAGIILNQSDVIALEVVGLRLAGELTPVTVEDRFHIGSNTKAWTATVGANLVNEDVISWDALPREVFDQPVLAEYEEITFEMLLRHEAGIPPYTEEEHYENLPVLDGSLTDQRIEFSKWIRLASVGWYGSTRRAYLFRWSSKTPGA